MAALSPLPAGVILRTVGNDIDEIFVRLRGHAGIALSFVVVFAIIGSVPEISNHPVVSEAFDLLSTIAILPFEIAIYRLLILGEVASGYHVAISTARFQRVLGWSVAMWALATIPAYLAGAITSSDAVNVVVGIAVIVIGIALIVRLAIFLPAIAVDAPGASIGNAFADTRGHAWLVVKAYLVVLLPFVLIMMPAAVLASLGGVTEAGVPAEQAWRPAHCTLPLDFWR